jgi:hypothetical protein
MSNLRPIVPGPVGQQPGQGTAELFQEQFIDANRRDRTVEQAQHDAFVGQPDDGPGGRVPGAGR